MQTLGIEIASYLVGIMVVLGIIIVVGLLRQKAGKNKEQTYCGFVERATNKILLPFTLCPYEQFCYTLMTAENSICYQSTILIRKGLYA